MGGRKHNRTILNMKRPNKWLGIIRKNNQGRKWHREIQKKKIPRNPTGYPVPCGDKMPSHKRPKQMESENESL